MTNKAAKIKKWTLDEAIEDYARKLERGEPVEDKGIVAELHRTSEYIEDLGEGNWQKGLERYFELEKERITKRYVIIDTQGHEQERRDNPALAMLEDMYKSDNPLHRVIAKKLALLADYPYEDFLAELKELTTQEVERSSKQLPAPIMLQTKRAGRKIDPWNKKTFDILNDGKENSDMRAFEYWCNAQGIMERTRYERDAFKKAMDRERKRRETN